MSRHSRTSSSRCRRLARLPAVARTMAASSASAFAAISANFTNGSVKLVFPDIFACTLRSRASTCSGFSEYTFRAMFDFLIFLRPWDPVAEPLLLVVPGCCNGSFRKKVGSTASLPGSRNLAQSGIPTKRELLAKSEGACNGPFQHLHQRMSAPSEAPSHRWMHRPLYNDGSSTIR